MGVTLSMKLTQVSQNKTDATSTVRVQVYATATGESFNNNSVGGSVFLSGNQCYYNGVATTQLTFEHGFSKNATTELYNTTIVVRHSSNGKASIVANAEYFTGVTAGRITAVASLTLDVINRPSIIALTSTGTPQFGKTVTFGITRFNSSYTHTLTAQAVKSGTYTGSTWTYNLGTIASSVGTSYTWTVPTSILSQMGSEEQCRIEVTCKTMSGSTQIGTSSCSFMCYLEGTDVPVFTSSSVTDSTGLYSTYGVYVQNKSILVVNAVATPTEGASIAKYETSLGSLYAYGTTTPLTLGSPPIAGQQDVRIRATDTRGRTILGTKAINVAEYSAPDFTIDARRTNSAGTNNDEGTYIRVTVEGSTTNVNNKGINTGYIVMRYKRETASSWSQQTYQAGTSLNHTFTISGATASIVYNIEVTVTDEIGTEVTRTADVGTAQPILDFKAGGGGIGILSVSDRDGIKTGGNFYMRPGDEMFGGGQLDFYFDENSTATKVAQIDSTGMSSVSRVNVNFSVPTNLPYPIMSRMYVGSPSSMTQVMAVDRNQGFNFYYDISAPYGDIPSLQIEDLNWTSLIGGDVGVTLWEGTWNSGYITATGANKYRLFAMCTNSSTDETILCVRSEGGSKLYAFGLCAYQDNYISLNAGTFTISGNRITRSMPRGWVINGTNITGANIVMYVYKVIGIL